jgi:hypothetical protein
MAPADDLTARVEEIMAAPDLPSLSEIAEISAILSVLGERMQAARDDATREGGS